MMRNGSVHSVTEALKRIKDYASISLDLERSIESSYSAVLEHCGVDRIWSR